MAQQTARRRPEGAADSGRVRHLRPRQRRRHGRSARAACATILPTYRAHNEQAMAHAAIAYAKAMRRRRFMACTTSIGPGATNMVTAAALAHVNRLPVLLLPGDVFASRRPDPVLQQVEDFGDPTVTANDCFRPVSRFWDRIMRPEQLLRSLPQALSRAHRSGGLRPGDAGAAAGRAGGGLGLSGIIFRAAPAPVHAAGRGPAAARVRRGVARPSAAAADHRGRRRSLLRRPASCWRSSRRGTAFPVAETQAGKGALRWDHPLNVGSIGVTGSSAANELAAEADVIVAIGTRLQDFTTASASLLQQSATSPDRHQRLPPRRHQVCHSRGAGRCRAFPAGARRIARGPDARRRPGEAGPRS